MMNKSTFSFKKRFSHSWLSLLNFKNRFLLLSFVFICFFGFTLTSYANGASDGSVGAIMQVNGGAKTSYVVNSNWNNDSFSNFYKFSGATPFSSANLGHVTGLLLNGMVIDGWTDSADFVTGQIEYRIWLQGGARPSVATGVFNIGGYSSGCAVTDVQSSSGNNRRVGWDGSSVNILNGLVPGIYNFEIISHGQMRYNCGSFNQKDNAAVSTTFTVDPVVTFNSNGGTGTMANEIVSYATSTALNANSYTRTGYSFSGWNTIANGSGTSYINSSFVSYNANGTLYAQWLAFPTITSFSAFPNNGTSTTGYIGSTVTVVGTDLSGATKVTVGGADIATTGSTATTATYIATSSIGTITITTLSGTSTSSGNAYASVGYITSTSSDWNIGSTWLGGSVPVAASNVTIANTITLNAPVANASFANVMVNSTSEIIIGTMGSLTITGSLANSGTITNSGLINNIGTITNSGTIKNKSNTFGTGYLLSGGSTANVTQEHYLSSNQRGWRLLSNPLSTTTFGTLASSSITSFVLGANASGSYDSVANTWSNGVDADAMVSQQAYKIFIRGVKSEVTALTYSTHPPSHVTVSISGTATNSTPTSIITTVGKFYLVANPYTAPVSVSRIIGASSGLSSTVSYYNPTNASSGIGTDLEIKKGGYDAVIVSGVAGSTTDVVLPPLGAVFVQATSSGSINIPKTTIYTGAISGSNYNHKMTNSKGVATSALTINVSSNGVHYDKLQLQFKEVGTAGSNIDFSKLPNTILDFYSIDGSINRSVSELEMKEQTIPLGITSSALQGFTFTISENTIPSGFEASLVDNLLNTTTVLAPATNYDFSIDASANSQGNSRFFITLKSKSLSVQNNSLDSKIILWPNPVHNQFYVLNNLQEGNVTFKIYSISGQFILSENAVAGSTSTINTIGWAPGVYLIEATNDGNKTTKQLIIQ